MLPVTLDCILCSCTSCTSSCPFYTTKNKGDKTQTLQESVHLQDIFLDICEPIIEIWNLKMTLPCSLHSSKFRVYRGGSMWSQTDFRDSEQLKHALIFNRHIGDRHLPLTMVRTISERVSYTTKKGRHYRNTLQLPNIDFRWRKWPDSLYFVNQIWGVFFVLFFLCHANEKYAKKYSQSKGKPTICPQSALLKMETQRCAWSQALLSVPSTPWAMGSNGVYFVSILFTTAAK